MAVFRINLSFSCLFSILFLVCLFFSLNDASFLSDDYLSIPSYIPPSDSSSSSVFNISTIISNNGNENLTIYLSIINDPLHAFHIYPSHKISSSITDQFSRIFTKRSSPSSPILRGNSYDNDFHSSSSSISSSFPSYSRPLSLDNQCAGAFPLSSSASLFDCKIAMNGGFFDIATGGCIGDVVSDGKLINQADSDAEESNAPHFLLTTDGKIIIGYLLNTTFQSLSLLQGIEGKGWLVRDSKSFIDNSIKRENIDNYFVTEKAPRTAVGVDGEGRIMIIAVDGEEDIHRGMDLYEWTDALIDIGFIDAINLDGGGSVTVINNGKIANEPRCNDTPIICERPVTTIVCLTK